MIRTIGRAIKQVALGAADLPQQCTVGMPDPQLEIRIWLEGLSEPVDVTNNHVVACASPFTVGIGLNAERRSQARLSLKFRERDGERRLLAKMGLRAAGLVNIEGQDLSLFQIQSCDNYCLARPRLWAYDLYQSFVRWRSDKDPEIPMSILGARSMNVFFMCPRPVVLVTAMHGDTGNIFPMNLLGGIGDGYFAFALNSLRKAAPLVERAGQVALSSIPLEYAGVARQLGKNHRLESIDWSDLPFTAERSAALGFPIPPFAQRVREMKIEAVRKLGSHTLFFARMISDERLGDALQFYMIHGIYQAWRLSTLPEQRGTSASRAES
jgi:flavin reductase (DIM6/NTAB) family NADH-FMN oxidoreductase RutF